MLSFYFPLAMSEKHQSDFIPTDELKERVSLDQVIDFYDVQPKPVLQQRGQHIRSRCFLLCGRTEETREDVLSIHVGDAEKRWRCFHKGCGKRGNLLGLCDLLKEGDNLGGRPRGQRFKAIARDLQAIVSGEGQVAPVSGGTEIPEHLTPASQPENVPLVRSDNEKARELVNLDEKFLLPSQVSEMPPAASRYFRLRPWLTDEIARQFRIGYLPSDSGGDNRGGTMRGKVVFGYQNESGEILTWFGRDPAFETKQQSDRNRNPPQKYRFVKGFQRGQELFGQQLFSQDPAKVRSRLQGLGLPVVAGPNDVMRFHDLGLPSLALCSPEYRVSREQAEKIARLARDVAGGIVWLLLPCTPEGELGMKQCLGYLSQLIAVRLGWNHRMFAGRYREKEAEQLQESGLEEIERFARTGADGS